MNSTAQGNDARSADWLSRDEAEERLRTLLQFTEACAFRRPYALAHQLDRHVRTAVDSALSQSIAKHGGVHEAALKFGLYVAASSAPFGEYLTKDQIDALLRR